VTPDDKGIALTSTLRDYLVDHSIPLTDAHRGLIEATARATGDRWQMQIPREQGSFMTLLARMTGAVTAVEVGTFTGYSALCIALGLSPGGRLLCFDISEVWPEIGRPYWRAAGVAERIEVRTGPAAQRLAELPEEAEIDLVFLDADKPGYVTYYELLVPRMRTGALLVADNVLYSGQVLDPTSEDENVVALRSFNDHVARDARVDATMLNVADGLLLARKR